MPQMDKAPVQAFADRVSGLFAPFVLFASLLTFVSWQVAAWTGFVPTAWLPAGQSPTVFSMLFGISVVVIACPCALGLATPTAVMVGTGVGAQMGVLIKGGAALETAHSVSTVIFDKTGTLTEGKPALVEAFLLPRLPGHGHAHLTRNALLRIIAAAESISEHPIGRAIAEGALRAASTDGASATGTRYEIDAESYEVIAGCGLRCRVTVPETVDSTLTLRIDSSHTTAMTVVIGNRSWLASNGIVATPAVTSVMEMLESRGRTAVLVAVNGSMMVVLGVADRVKPEAHETVRALQAIGIEVYMVTGDHLQTALHVAAAVGITPSNVIAGVRPADKAGKVAELQVCLG